jgi:hypothetical protein
LVFPLLLLLLSKVYNKKWVSLILSCIMHILNMKVISKCAEVQQPKKKKKTSTYIKFMRMYLQNLKNKWISNKIEK